MSEMSKLSMDLSDYDEMPELGGSEYFVAGSRFVMIVKEPRYKGNEEVVFNKGLYFCWILFFAYIKIYFEF